MSRLKLINAPSMERLLFKIGFIKVRQKGSHGFYRHADGRTTTIPFHKGKDLLNRKCELKFLERHKR